MHKIRFSLDFIENKVRNRDYKLQIGKGKYIANMKMYTLKTFAHKGHVCAGCGKCGSYYEVREGKAQWGKGRDYYLALVVEWTSKSGKLMKMDMTSDHIIPKSKGGANGLINRQTMCSKCNWTKADYDTLEEALKHRKYKTHVEPEYISQCMSNVKKLAKLKLNLINDKNKNGWAFLVPRIAEVEELLRNLILIKE